MVRHIVVWTLRDELNGMSKKQIAEKMKQDLESLNGVISEIVKLEVGINCAYEGKNADVVLVGDFASMADLEVYANHPEHLKCVGFIKSAALSRTAVDYEF
ncbi:MAG: Dabb family protein [Salinivirgaceae bacterium]|nr:Dabb family protein [Salinivirgaceae bacterium]